MSTLYGNQSTTGGFNYAPVTEENGPLAKYKVGETVHKVVRAMSCRYSDGNGFYIYEVEEDDRWFTIKGSFPYDLDLNAYYEISGTVVVDKKRGNRLINVLSCTSTFPTTKMGIITVLQTLHGLDTQAHKLYDLVGPTILDDLMKDPDAVAAKVKGVGVKRARIWQQELLAKGAMDKELQKLYEMGLTQQQASKLVCDDGIEICESVHQNPYLLIGKVRGYSFSKCDKFAQDTGHSTRDPVRIMEGIKYAMSCIEMKGHCTYPKEQFMQVVHNLLDVSINLQAAKQILKIHKPGETFKGRWGSNIYTVYYDDLADDLHEWEYNPSNRQVKQYRYVLDYIEDSVIEQAMNSLKTISKVVVEDSKGTEFVTPGHFYDAERIITSGLKEISLNGDGFFSNKDSVIAAVTKQLGVTLEKKQLEAVREICSGYGGAFILNGSAGCGKTFTLNIIMKVLEILYKANGTVFNPCILAPTGKAAKVAAAATHLPAQTIHKAFGLVSLSNENEIQISSKSISNNCIVVDEFSMVDELLCATLIDGVPKTSKVIFLGDTEQLPSIRAGKVLKDLINSNAIPVITLDVVKRQDAKSGILHNANRIILGQDIETFAPNPNGTKGNAYVLSENDQQKAQDKIIDMAKAYGLAAFQRGDVQVLSPLKAGAVGIEALNYHIQQALNPKAESNEIVVGRMKLKDADGSEEDVPKVFRVGDCVINVRNNYKQPWFSKHPINGFIEMSSMGVVNGDTGVVAAISIFKDGNNLTHRIIYVKYDDHYIAYDNEYDDLALAYALTIHKSQGSQWPNVICPLTQWSIILNRKLLYTMYTRAQDSCTLIGSPMLIHKTILNNREDLRLTLLQERLQKRVY